MNMNLLIKCAWFQPMQLQGKYSTQLHQFILTWYGLHRPFALWHEADGNSVVFFPLIEMQLRKNTVRCPVPGRDVRDCTHLIILESANSVIVQMPRNRRMRVLANVCPMPVDALGFHMLILTLCHILSKWGDQRK